MKSKKAKHIAMPGLGLTAAERGLTLLALLSILLQGQYRRDHGEGADRLSRVRLLGLLDFLVSLLTFGHLGNLLWRDLR